MDVAAIWIDIVGGQSAASSTPRHLQSPAWPRLAVAPYVGADHDALVFTAPRGGPLFRGTFARDVWRPAVLRAGLAGITFHGLRHSFVAILVAAGCNVREVSEWAGHNSVAFRLTRYGGLFEDGSEAAVDRLDALLGGKS
jgi:integrase